MIDFFTFDFDLLQADIIAQVIFSDNFLTKGKKASLQRRLNLDEKLYSRLVTNLKFAKFLTGRLAVNKGSCACDETALQLLNYAKKINKTHFKLPELRALISSFDTIQVIAPSGLTFGLNKKQMLHLLLSKAAKNWAYEVQLAQFIQKKGYFYLVPDAGHLDRWYANKGMAICFDDNSIRVRANRVDKYFDVVLHELTHAIFNQEEGNYFTYDEPDPFIDVISEAEAYATTFFVEKGWDVFQKMKRLTLLKTKKEMQGEPLFDIYQETMHRLKKEYVSLFLADDTPKAFDEMVKKAGVRKVFPQEKRHLCAYLKRIKQSTIQTSLCIDNFALKVPHPEFLTAANRYLSEKFGPDVSLNAQIVQKWARIFRRKQNWILNKLQQRER